MIFKGDMCRREDNPVESHNAFAGQCACTLDYAQECRGVLRTISDPATQLTKFPLRQSSIMVIELGLWSLEDSAMKIFGYWESV